MKRSVFALFALVLLAACGASRAPRLVAPLSYAAVPAQKDEDFRAWPPPAVPLDTTPTFTLAKAQLGNGMSLVLVERHGLPVFAARLLVTRGARDLPGERADLLDLGMDVILRQHQSSPEASPDVRPGAGCEADSCSIAAGGSSRSFEPTLRAIAALAMRPRYAPSEEVRMHRDWNNALSTMGGTPDAALFINARALLFPPGDAYAPDTAAGRKRIAAASMADLARLHAQLFQPQHATLLVSGDVALEDLKSAAERAFGAWKATVPLPPNTTPPPTPGAAGRTVLVDYPVPLVHAYFVARGPTGNDPAVLSLDLFGMLLGTPSGALSHEVRANMGATYNVSASLATARSASYFAVGGAFEPDKALAAVTAVLRALRAARDGELPAVDFEGARTRTIAGYRSAAGTAAGATGFLEELLSAGEPPEAALSRTATVARLTPAEVQAAARAWLSDGALRLVVVGPKKQIQSGFEKLGIGAVEWRNRRAEAAR